MRNFFGRALTALLLVTTVLFTSALTCFAQDNTRQEIQKYTAEIQRNPNNAEAYYNRGNAYNDLKQYERAISDFSKAIHLKPSYAAAYMGRGSAYFQLKQYQKAIGDFTNFIDLVPEPDDILGYIGRSMCYRAMGDNARAAADSAKVNELMDKFKKKHGIN